MCPVQLGVGLLQDVRWSDQLWVCLSTSHFFGVERSFWSHVEAGSGGPPGCQLAILSETANGSVIDSDHRAVTSKTCAARCFAVTCLVPCAAWAKLILGSIDV